MSIDITGLDHAAVLAALYNNSRQQGLGFFHSAGARDMTVEQAAQELAVRQPEPYFDYLHGRVMKIAIVGDQINPRLYDRDNGDGAAAAAIETLRRNTAAA